MIVIENHNSRAPYLTRGGLSAELSREELMHAIPSAYSEGAHAKTSSRYSFFSTDTVIEALRESGWAPASGQQQRARALDRSGFQKHLIRFHRREELGRAVLHDSRLELVLVNSHDGGCAFQLHAGIFRLVCSNGLIISEASYGAVSIRHSHRTVDQVIEASQAIAQGSDRIGSRVDDFRQRELSDAERTEFAARALALRYETSEAAPVYPDKLLQPVRWEDVGRSLWQTFNVVQERMMRGSRPDYIKAHREGRRGARVRALTGLDAQLDMNRNLWELAVSYLN